MHIRWIYKNNEVVSLLEPKTRRENFIRGVIFHESTPYYEMELRRITLSLSNRDDQKSSKSESKQNHKPIAAALKPLSTVARAALNTKPKNLESNLGSV